MASGGRREAMKTVIWGLVWLVGAVALWLQAAGNLIHDLRLALSASVAQGHVTDSWEDAEDGDDGRLNWHHAVAFTFVLADGREVKSGARGDGRLLREFVDLKQPVPVEVEYLAASPTEP